MTTRRELLAISQKHRNLRSLELCLKNGSPQSDVEFCGGEHCWDGPSRAAPAIDKVVNRDLSLFSVIHVRSMAFCAPIIVPPGIARCAPAASNSFGTFGVVPLLHGSRSTSGVKLVWYKTSDTPCLHFHSALPTFPPSPILPIQDRRPPKP